MDAKTSRRYNLLILEREYGSLAEIERATEKAFSGTTDQDPVTASYLSQIKGGRGMGDDVARRLERLKPNFRAGWMDRPLSPQHVLDAARGAYTIVGGGDAPMNVMEAPADRSRLPLISWVSAGLKDEAADPYAPGNAEDWIPFESEASKSAFCLRVRGRSMESSDGSEPTFPDGCFIAIEPRRKPKSGEFAVFRFNDSDEATFKQYVANGPLKLLKPINPDPEYKIIAIGPDAQLVGTVFEKRIVRRY